MTELRSLHIGLNAVDPASYGAAYELVACEADAADMRAVAEARGFTAEVLLTSEATCAAVIQALSRASAELSEGDLFFLTYSGHGGQVDDIDGDEEEDDLDETWCLFDTQLRDDDLNTAFASFAAGVRILMLSDSCHSGSVNRDIAAFRDSSLGGGAGRDKRLPLTATNKEFVAHENLYRDRAVVPQSQVVATGALISGCQDNQTSKDGDRNGAFTAAFLSTWRDGAFPGDHNELYASICQTLKDGRFEQLPNLQTLATEDDAFRGFLAQRPLASDG